MKRKLPALAAIALSLGVAACGSSGDHGKNASDTTKAQKAKAAKAAAVQKRETALYKQTQSNLKSRPKNEIILDGFSQGSLSQAAYQHYQTTGGTQTVSIGSDSAATAFNDLCTGSVDVVDSSSSITNKELATCENDDVTPVQIQVGSDAVVLATENETDVGADCLTVPQVQAIFKAGSPIENWDQLGFDDVPLTTAGPNPANADFAFFGSSLVGTGTPTLQDFRFDYRAYANEQSIRQFVVGSLDSGELASSKLPAAEDEITSTDALIAGQNDVVRGAKAAEKSSIQTKNATQLALAKARLAKATRELKILGAELVAEKKVVAGYQSTERQSEGVLGHLGVFQYGFYTLYEEQLRPLEITTKADPENCVFPSQDTITSGDYPLSRQLLLTFSLQELRQDPGLRQFLLSYLEDANSLNTTQGLVALPNNVLVQEEDWLEGKKAPTVVTGASGTSGGENSMSGVTGDGQVSASSGASSSSVGVQTDTTTSGVPTGVH